MTADSQHALVDRWHERLAEHPPQRIAFTDGTDDRVLTAAASLTDTGVVRPVVVGVPDEIDRAAQGAGVSLDGIAIADVRQAASDDLLIRRLTIALHGRQHRPIEQLMLDPLYVGALLLASGQVDGCVSGASVTSAAVIRAGLRTIGLGGDTSVVSSSFLLILPDGRPVAYGDCAVIPEPNAEELAEIALSTAATFRLLAEEDPIVAMLSYSTMGSADTASSRRVRLAADETRRRAPRMVVDGELQFDAAASPRVADIKAPGSAARGKANVFIFPNLDAGNIGYKLTQYFAEADAFGPLLQGMARPLNDLSRGCTAHDVAAVGAITALQALDSRPVR